MKKIHNNLQGEEIIALRDYEELFNKCLEKQKDNVEPTPEVSYDVNSDFGKKSWFSLITSKLRKTQRTRKPKESSKNTEGKATAPLLSQPSRISPHSAEKIKSKSTQSDTGEKILAKADPGMGKTTFCKKVGFDWALGLFKTFSIIFFVFLKFVKPDATIENIIIEQNPHMKGLNITDSKLENIWK